MKKNRIADIIFFCLPPGKNSLNRIDLQKNFHEPIRFCRSISLRERAAALLHSGIAATDDTLPKTET
jgi:hypothetical protein